MQIGELKKIAVIGAGDMGHGIAQAVSHFVCKKARPFSGRAFLRLPGVLLRQKRRKADEKKADRAQDGG